MFFSENLFIGYFWIFTRQYGTTNTSKHFILKFTRRLVLPKSGRKRPKLSQKFTLEVSTFFFMNVEGYRYPEIAMWTTWIQKYSFSSLFHQNLFIRFCNFFYWGRGPWIAKIIVNWLLSTTLKCQNLEFLHWIL